jgi:hypothetical protein
LGLVEEIVKWDDCLRKTQTFSTAYLILVSRKYYGSPLLNKQQTLLSSICQPAGGVLLPPKIFTG